MEHELDHADWLDASRRETLDLCPRKYFYRHELHLQPKGQFSPDTFNSALLFGSAWHAAMACWYEDPAKAVEMVTCPCPTMEGCEFCGGQKIPRIMMQFLIHYPWDPIKENDPRTRSRGVEFIQSYFSKWRRENFEVLGTEVAFILPIAKIENSEEVDFYLVGKIDALIKELDEIKVVDHKTTTRYGEQFTNQFRLSHQFTGYMKAVGVIMQVPCNQGKVNVVRITTKVDPDESYLRLDVARTDPDFAEWEQETRQAMADIRRYRAQNFWPKRAPFACSAYNRTCPYYGPCAADQANREELLANGYEKIQWSPIEDTEP